MMTLNEVTAKIVGWANDRCLLERRYLLQQCVKLGEELGEVAAAAEADNFDEALDGVGDCYVVAAIMAAQLGSSIAQGRRLAEGSPVISTMSAFGAVCSAVARGKDETAIVALGSFINTMEMEAKWDGIILLDAVLSAWETIKDRKGRMVDGVFIKENDNG